MLSVGSVKLDPNVEMEVLNGDGTVDLLMHLCCRRPGKYPSPIRLCHGEVVEQIIKYCHDDVISDLKIKDAKLLARYGRRAFYQLDRPTLMTVVDEVWENAAYSGNMTMLEHLKELKVLFVSDACSYASLGGHLTLVRWFYRHGIRLRSCAEAARSGNIELVKWLKINDVAWDNLTCAAAATGGHLPLLQWLRSPFWVRNDCQEYETGGYLPDLCPWDQLTCTAAAAIGRIDILDWCRNRKITVRGDAPCPWDEGTCAAAASHNQPQTLKWLRGVRNGNQQVDDVCPWDDRTCEGVAGSGNFELLRWCRAQGCPWTRQTCELIAMNGRIDMLEWCRNPTFSQEEITPFTRWDPCPLDPNLVSHILPWLDIPTLNWLRDNGADFESVTVNRSVSRATVNWLLTNQYITSSNFY
jgi:hypothetical protein